MRLGVVAQEKLKMMIKLWKFKAKMLLKVFPSEAHIDAPFKNANLANGVHTGPVGMGFP